MQYDDRVGLKVQNVGAQAGNVGSPCRMLTQKTTNTVNDICYVQWGVTSPTDLIETDLHFLT